MRSAALFRTGGYRRQPQRTHQIPVTDGGIGQQVGIGLAEIEHAGLHLDTGRGFARRHHLGSAVAQQGNRHLVRHPRLVDTGGVQQPVARAVQFDDGTGRHTAAEQLAGSAIEGGEVGEGGFGRSAAVRHLLSRGERRGRKALLSAAAIETIENAGSFALDTEARQDLLFSDAHLWVQQRRFQCLLKRQQRPRRLRPRRKGDE